METYFLFFLALVLLIHNTYLIYRRHPESVTDKSIRINYRVDDSELIRVKETIKSISEIQSKLNIRYSDYRPLDELVHIVRNTVDHRLEINYDPCEGWAMKVLATPFRIDKCPNLRAAFEEILKQMVAKGIEVEGTKE